MPYVEQISFLESIAPKEARYKAVACMGDDSVFSQQFHLSRDVPAALDAACRSGQNTYLSLCDYIQPRRGGEFVFGFTAFGFDIDCHQSIDPAADALTTYRHLKATLFNTAAFPAPSMVEHTGRGLLVIIAFRRVPRQVLPLWLRMGEAFAERLRGALPPFAVLDNTYNDAARVVRVPNSYNTKAGRRARLLDFSEDYPLYQLDALRDAYCPQLHPSNYRKKGNPKKGAPILFTDSAIKLHVDRLDDLVKLCELRRFRLDGMREKVLFLYRYWTCFYIGPQAALEAARQLNARFTSPLPAAEVTGATRSAEEAFQRWREDKKKGYNYRNATLIELLAIAPAEQQKLKTIISPQEKARRRAKKAQWGNGKRDEQRKESREQRDKQIADAVASGLSLRQVSEQFRCDRRTIRDILLRVPAVEQSSLL